jgi:hypothetical protein
VGACAGSDKPQKLLRFNSAQKLPFVRMRLESIQLPKPFQAEYTPGCYVKSPSSANVGIGGCASTRHAAKS